MVSTSRHPKYTWTQSTRNLRRIIDHVIVKQNTRLKVTNVRAMRVAEYESDHHLLVAKIYLPYAATPERKIQQDEQDVQRQQLKSWNIDSLQNDSTRFLYQFRLATKLSDLKDRSPEEIYELLKRRIHEAAYEALEKITIKRQEI
ncbi:hypothetical protein HHI36_010643 [Cryptolaemus montrouzieri]|uniref:Uncharacterized protein n=1 Tax=Cryptolaemus montrouzieri TaxID=559131 RepID=A0ABD2MJD2_9CUCU